MSVKSTYNFVPVPNEKEVFLPDWADKVSHDIPFSDGESGEIELRITAETPIFIRNGHSKEDVKAFENFIAKKKKDNSFKPNDEDQKRIDKYLSFSNIDGKHFIPATSLKGMFRNVLEIMSFSRMRQIKGITDNEYDVFGLRDMNNDEYSKSEIRNIKSGWLTKKEEKWIINECSNHRISIKSIEDKFGLRLNSLKNISAIEKYELCKLNNHNNQFSFSFSQDLGKFVGKEYNIDSYGDFEGSIVMFGDIDNKRYDFIFSKKQKIDYEVDEKLIDVMDSLEKDNKNSLWKFFKNRKGDIPVFFKLDDTNRVKHFGFSKLYRLNNSNYINNLEPIKSYQNSNFKKNIDFGELIFGNTRENPLKGRVFFSHAFAENVIEIPETERILNSPKPSFYPAYLKQDGDKGILKVGSFYKTYLNSNSELKGYKRYPVHLDIKPNIESENENISSLFKPLDKQTTFEFKVRYHNLRKTEIGALISAMTFHGNTNDFFHSIGSAKPYGFGKIKVELKSKKEYDKYLQEFEFEINKHLEKINDEKNKSFTKSETINELLSIASSPIDKSVDRLLLYPKIESIKGNEFNEYKKNKKYLENYSERNKAIKIKSLITSDFFEKKENHKKELLILKNKEENKILEKIKFLVKEIEDFKNQEKYRDAILKIKELNLINEVKNKDKQIQDLEKLIKDKELKVEVENLIKRESLEELNEFIKNFPFHERANEIRSLIKRLSPKLYPERYNKIDLKLFLKEVPHWIRKNNINIADFEKELISNTKRVINVELENNKKRKAWEDFENRNTWGLVKDIIGSDNAKRLFEELI